MSEKEVAEEVVESPEIDFKPLVSLPLVEVKTLEDNEDELLKLRAKLFRFDSSNDPPEWKERGIGEIKLMMNKHNSNVRLIMRRDKTHKICANHLLTKEMKLLPSAGSDRAWVWNVMADFADEEPKKEQLAIRFRNAEIAQKFKNEFEKCQEALPDIAQTNDLANNLGKLSVDEEESENNVSNPSEASKSCEDSKGGDAVENQPSDETNEGSPPGSETVLHDQSEDTATQQDSSAN